MNPNPISDPATEQWHTTFVGQHMQHNYRLYFVLDEVFRTQTQIEGIVEIGTGCGALTTYLALWSKKKGLKGVASFDRERLCDHAFLTSLGVVFEYEDVFSPKCILNNPWYAFEKAVLFICDGGDKQREFETFAPKLKSGSIICAHDLGAEFFDEKISAELKLKLDPLLPNRWMECNVRFAIYKVK